MKSREFAPEAVIASPHRHRLFSVTHSWRTDRGTHAIYRIAFAAVALIGSVPTLSFGAQSYYISAASSGTTGTSLTSSGTISTHAAPVETCPAGITPNWPASSLVAPAFCFVEATNSVGDAVLLAGDAYLVSHTGVVTDLSTSFRMLVATGINSAGDIVGYADYDTTTFQFVLPGVDGGGCTYPSPSSCHGVAVLLRAGTSSLIDLNALLSPSLTTPSSQQGLLWYAISINDSGQILCWSLTAKNEAQWVGTFVLTPCTAGSCPADTYSNN